MPSEPMHLPHSPHTPLAPHVRTPMGRGLRAVESFLLSGGQQTARRNAWAAVVADRQRARDRRDAQYEMDALTAGRSVPGVLSE